MKQYKIIEKSKEFAKGMRDAYRTLYPEGATFRENLYRTRRYVNIFGGAMLGAAAPVAAARYVFFPSIMESGNPTMIGIIGEAGVWGLSAICAFPLLAGGGVAGFALGTLSAFELDAARNKGLEDRIEEENV